MLLPKRDNAFVPREKLIDYLLSESHPVGKSKAKYFQALGFDETNWEDLADGLIGIAQSSEVESVQSTPFGEKYVVTGTLSTPAGKDVEVKTVWIIEQDSDQPRLVTAYPA